MPPLPGVILFPTDLSLLHQFFSVVLLATNGAPDGDVLRIRGLTAKVRLPAGLAQARTEPPTTLGTPVPARVPGPDGELGTADDLTFLVAQATGIRRLSGTARGAVVVRDPTLGIVVSHPDVVRADEEYTMEVSVTNNGVTPANLVSLALPHEVEPLLPPLPLHGLGLFGLGFSLAPAPASLRAGRLEASCKSAAKNWTSESSRQAPYAAPAGTGQAMSEFGWRGHQDSLT